MTLYHGSNHKLEPGDFIRIENSKSSVMVDGEWTPAIFASGNMFYSLSYALCEFGGILGNNKYASVFTTRPDMAATVVFYNMLCAGYVYEVDAESFTHGAADGVASIKDARIIKRHDLTPEFLRQHGYRVRKSRFPKMVTHAVLKRIDRKADNAYFAGKPLKNYDRIIGAVAKTMD